jgi:hypothetical protein
MKVVQVIKKGKQEDEKTPVNLYVVQSKRKSDFADLRRRFLSLHEEAMRRLDDLEAMYASLK